MLNDAMAMCGRGERKIRFRDEGGSSTVALWRIPEVGSTTVGSVGAEHKSTVGCGERSAPSVSVLMLWLVRRDATTVI